MDVGVPGDENGNDSHDDDDADEEEGDVGIPGDEDDNDNYDDDDADAVDEEGNVWHTSGASPCSAPFRSLRRGKTGQPEELSKK